MPTNRSIFLMTRMFEMPSFKQCSEINFEEFVLALYGDRYSVSCGREQTPIEYRSLSRK